MSRPTLLEAYARRLVAALSSDLGGDVESIQRTFFEAHQAEVMEWKAVLAGGVEIRLSAAILGSRPGEAPSELSRSDREEMRALGISPEDQDLVAR
jgi:hypothetical protein